MIKLLRSLLVNTTLPETALQKTELLHDSDTAGFAIFELSFLASIVPGLIAGRTYNRARMDQDLADQNMRLLYASALSHRPKFKG